MFVKLAATGKMAPGRLEQPVAIRRVHAANRSSLPRPAWKVYRDQMRMWAVLWRWGRTNLPRARRQLLVRRFLESAGKPFSATRSRIGGRLLSGAQLSLLGLLHPGLWFESHFWLSCVRAAVPFRLRAGLKRLAAPKPGSASHESTNQDEADRR